MRGMRRHTRPWRRERACLAVAYPLDGRVGRQEIKSTENAGACCIETAFALVCKCMVYSIKAGCGRPHMWGDCSSRHGKLASFAPPLSRGWAQLSPLKPRRCCRRRKLLRPPSCATTPTQTIYTACLCPPWAVMESWCSSPRPGPGTAAPGSATARGASG
jgi:hypothetical protein